MSCHLTQILVLVERCSLKEGLLHFSWLFVVIGEEACTSDELDEAVLYFGILKTTAKLDFLSVFM